jgi:hypothetical protein
VLSAPRELVVQPTLATAATANGGAVTITATSNGGAAGDAVVLLTRRDGRWVVEQRARLDGAGAVLFQVPAPAGVRTYAVRLEANANHAAAESRVTVSPAPPPGASGPTAPNSDPAAEAGQAGVSRAGAA